MNYWAIAPEWKGETVFIIGGGTSVLTQNVNVLAGRRVLAVNSSYETAPFAQFLFFGDFRWWNEHRLKPALQAFPGRIVTCSARVRDDRVLKLRRIEPPPGFATSPDSVASLRTSLQGAMNMAAHLGAAEIVLLGADMGRGVGGKTHHHSPHPWKNKTGNRTWDIQMAQLESIVAPLQERRIRVWNTSLASRIPWWPKRPLEDCLDLRRPRYSSGRWVRSLAAFGEVAA